MNHTEAVRIFSRGILKIPHLPNLLGARVLTARSAEQESFVGVWGAQKKSGKKALEYAQRKSKNVLYLEEALYKGFAPLDMPLGIIRTQGSAYYDATKSTSFAQYLNDNSRDFLPEQVEYVHDCWEMILKYKLSKYNSALPLEDFDALSRFFQHHKHCVLLIDQTFGDQSVTLGDANADSFKKMYERAVKLYPNHMILLKVHPLVSSGSRGGYLRGLYEDLREDERKRIRLIEENVNIGALFPFVEEVFVVTSQAGFDALIHKKRVRCFGKAFYGGWGLTTDEVDWQPDLRQKKVSLEELFWAIAIHCTHYASPTDGRSIDLLEALEYLALQKRHKTLGSSHRVIFYNIRRWKRRVLEQFLGLEKNQSIHIWGHERLALFLRAQCAIDNKKVKIVIWGVKDLKALEAYKSRYDVLCIEDGFLRSVGLGAHFISALSLAVDSGGMYFLPNGESGLEKMLSEESWCRYEERRAQELKECLKARSLSKYNLFGAQDFGRFLKQNNVQVPCTLVAGQVEDDASILFGAENIKTNFALLQKVIEKVSSGCILYKPHPDVLGAGRLGALSEAQWTECLAQCEAKGLKLLDVRSFDITSCFAHVHSLHVITSTAGLEALLHGIEVHTYGRAFYAGYGLTVDAQIFENRAPRSLWELVAACYMFYPRYRLPNINYFTNVFDVVEYIAVQKKHAAEEKKRKSVSPLHLKLLPLKRFTAFCIRSIQGFV